MQQHCPDHRNDQPAPLQAHKNAYFPTMGFNLWPTLYVCLLLKNDCYSITEQLFWMTLHNPVQNHRKDQVKKSEGLKIRERKCHPWWEGIVPGYVRGGPEDGGGNTHGYVCEVSGAPRKENTLDAFRFLSETFKETMSPAGSKVVFSRTRAGKNCSREMIKATERRDKGQRPSCGSVSRVSLALDCTVTGLSTAIVGHITNKNNGAPW